MTWLYFHKPSTDPAAGGPTYAAGATADVRPGLAAIWLADGTAEALRHTDPADIQAVEDRLGDGAGEPCLFAPYLGEFGLTVLHRARIVHFHRAARKVVCCRPGEQALYPSADVLDLNWHDPIPDSRKGGGVPLSTGWPWPELQRRWPLCHLVPAHGFTYQQELVYLRPGEKIPFNTYSTKPTVDVVLGVRRREARPDFNWPLPHWQAVADALTAAGITFAVLAKRATHGECTDLLGMTYHTDGDLDLGIRLLRHARLFIGGDSGAAHLAAAVGTPSLLVRPAERCRADRDFDYLHRMTQENPATRLVLGGWENPHLMIDAALKQLGIHK